MSMGACVPIIRKILKLLLPFAYYFCSNILLDIGDLHLVKNIRLRNFDSVSKDHRLGMYVYVMEAYTI